ncbi:MAG: DUF7948 domain-containing protein, partial [Armatimonadota bacterium]
MRGRAWVRRIRVMVTLIGLIALLIDLPGPASPLGSGAVPKPAARQQLVDMYGRLPMHFEANLGRTDPSVQFLARGRGYGLLLTSTEAVLVLRHPVRSAVVRMRLVGANPAPTVSGRAPLPGKVNYFIGNDPNRWRTNIPTYASVHYEAVYPGIDLVYYGTQRALEYDFVVAPGSDPEAITVSLEG